MKNYNDEQLPTKTQIEIMKLEFEKQNKNLQTQPLNQNPLQNLSNFNHNQNLFLNNQNKK